MIYAAIALLLAALPSHADYRSEYDFVQNRSCRNGGTPLDARVASQVAKLAVERKLDSYQFLEVFIATCDTSLALTVARESKARRIDYFVFDRAIDYACRSGAARLNGKNALFVARETMKQTIDTSAYLTGWNATCDLGIAAIVGRDAQARSLDHEVFFKAFHFQCEDGRRWLTELGALEIARLKASDRIDAEKFFKAYRTGCDYEVARKAAMRDQLSDYSGPYPMPVAHADEAKEKATTTAAAVAP